jgi:hypothetical protein
MASGWRTAAPRRPGWLGLSRARALGTGQKAGGLS